MYKIRVLNNISQQGLRRLDPSNYQLIDDDDNDNVDAILLRSASLHNMTVSNELKAIARAGAGVNNIPLDKMTTNGIAVFNTPGANANAVKELVIASLLIASRHLCQSWHVTKDLTGDNIPTEVESIKKQFAGQELMGKTLGLIGLGAIGVKVANTCADLGMNVIAFDPHLTVDNAWQLSPMVSQAPNMTDVMHQADYVTLHVPYSEKTHHLIDESIISKMKPTATLLNFSRGGIVDETSLLKLLNQDKLNRYITDFPNQDLLQCDKVLCFPHLGASTAEAEENCAVMAVNTLKQFLQWGEIENSVNLPTIRMAYQGGTRIAIVNHNIPNMLSQISQIIAQHSLNIKDMINRSRNDIAYTLLDVNNKIDETIINSLNNIQGVINCRVICYDKDN